VIFADIVFILLCLVDDNKLFLHQLSELYLLTLFDDCQLLFLELGDRDDIVVIVVIVVVILSGLDASRLPDQSSFDRKSRIPSSKISLLP
jgi:hypothetical protein